MISLLVQIMAREHDIIFYIRLLNKYISEDFDKRLEEHGITGQQCCILFHVNHFYEQGENIHQSNIEKNFHLSKSTVSGLVKRLMNNGFIKREKDSSLVPTTKGKETVEEFRTNRKKTIERLLTGFSEEERAKAEENLYRLITNMGGELDDRKH